VRGLKTGLMGFCRVFGMPDLGITQRTAKLTEIAGFWLFLMISPKFILIYFVLEFKFFYQRKPVKAK